jgi:TPP-dependent indolepyruvate ferredoxin oxidoreductase alpha subunit
MSKIIFGRLEFPARPWRRAWQKRSFAREVEDLKLGAGQEFRGEGILAITKALLECSVSYVADYQGAPISHLMDVLSDAQDILSLRTVGTLFEDA